MSLGRALRDLGWAVAATVTTRRRDAVVRRVRRLAPYAVRVATPVTDPRHADHRAAFGAAVARYGGVLDAHYGNELWAYFAEAPGAVCARAEAAGLGLEVAAWDTRLNPRRPYYATYVDGYGPR